MTFLKVIGFLGCAILTLLSGIFGMISLCALILSIVDGCLISAVASIASAFFAVACWGFRKEPLL